VRSGIIRILRTGAPWRALPERFGSPKTGSSRFSRWRRAGTWQRILERLQQLRLLRLCVSRVHLLSVQRVDDSMTSDTISGAWAGGH
jgi:transposase